MKAVWLGNGDLGWMEPENEGERAFALGYNTEKLSDNPYKDETAEARHFVDGWVERVKSERGLRGDEKATHI